VLRKRWFWIGAFLAAVIAIALTLWSLQGEFAYARIATGYAAKQTCSCLHVSGRPLESCLADFPEDARDNVAVGVSGDQVRASVLFGAISASAVYEEGFGCRLLD